MTRAERRRAEIDSHEKYVFTRTTQFNRAERRARGKERTQDISRMKRLRAGRANKDDLFWCEGLNWKRLMKVALERGMMK